MRAVFRGKNGSLGFITGQEYSLSLSRYGGLFRKVDGVEITTISNGQLKYCCYDSVELFLNNWELI